MIKAARAVGLNSDQEAALAILRKHEESNSHLFILVKTTSDDAFVLCRNALSAGEDIFTASTSLDSEKILEVFHSLAQSLKDTSNLQIIVAILQNSDRPVLYLVYSGEEVSANLLRGEKSSNLVSMAERGSLISGFLESQDRLLICTSNFLEVVSLEELRRIEVDSFEDEVTIKMPPGQILPEAAILIENFPEVTTERQRDLEIPVPFNFRLPKISLPRLQFSRRGIFAGVVILLIGGLILAFFLNKNWKNHQTSNQLNTLILNSQDNFAKAKAETDTVKAVQYLNTAKELSQEALKIDPNSEQVKNLQTEIEQASEGILKIYKIDNLPLWLDLSLIKKEFTASKISSSLGKILLLDLQKKTLVLIDQTNKSQQIGAGEDKLGDASFVALNGDIAWVYSKDKGMVKVEISKSTVSEVIKKDDDWGEISDIYGFGGNLYLLDTSKNNIWKYLPVVGGYSDKRSYLQEGSKADFKGAIKLQIDSSVYLLQRNGEVLKFTQGQQDNFSISGLDKPIKQVISIFVSDQTDNFYLLEANRLLVFDKIGNYKLQYLADCSLVTDLVVDEQLKKAFLLAKDKILQIDLK